MRDRVIVDARTAAAITDVKPATVRQWVHRGKITRQPDGGIDVHELIEWLDRRDPKILATRAGLRGEARQCVETGTSRAARLLREAIMAHGEMVRVTPNAAPDTPDFGGWLRPRRI